MGKHEECFKDLSRAVIKAAIKDNDIAFFDSEWFEFYCFLADLEPVKARPAKDEVRDLYEKHSVEELAMMTGHSIEYVFKKAWGHGWKIGSQIPKGQRHRRKIKHD